MKPQNNSVAKKTKTVRFARKPCKSSPRNPAERDIRMTKSFKVSSRTKHLTSVSGSPSKNNLRALLKQCDMYVPKKGTRDKSTVDISEKKGASDQLYELFTKCSEAKKKSQRNKFVSNASSHSRSFRVKQSAKASTFLQKRVARNVSPQNPLSLTKPKTSSPDTSLTHTIFEKNLFSKVRYFVLQQTPSQEANIFILLSKYGSVVDECSFKGQEKIQWSSRELWFFSQVHRDGFPWDITTSQKLKSASKGLLNAAKQELPVQDRKQKLLDVSMINNLQMFLHKEWNLYKRVRDSTLQFLGMHALEKRENLTGSSEDNALNPVQGIVWQSNSCAYDAVLSILPHLAVSAMSCNISRKEVFGSNALCFTPVAVLKSGFDALEGNCSSTAKISNWIRQFAVDILRDAVSETSSTLEDRNLSWSPFTKANTYCDIGELYGLIQAFFESKRFPIQISKSVTVLEVSSFFLYEEVVASFHSSNATTLPRILFRILVRSLKSAHADRITLQPCLGVFSSNLNQNDTESQKIQTWFSSLCKGEWEGAFSLSEDELVGTGTRNWRLKLLAMTSCARYNKSHFVSATCIHDPPKCFLYHDGLRAGGFIRKLDVSSVINEHMDMTRTFFTACVYPLTSES